MTQILAFTPAPDARKTVIAEASGVVESLCEYRTALAILAERKVETSVHLRGSAHTRLEGLLNTKIGDDRPINHMRPVEWGGHEKGYHFFLQRTDQFPAFTITKRRTSGTEREFVLYVHGHEIMCDAKIGPICDRAKSHISKKIRAQQAARSMTEMRDYHDRMRRRAMIGLKLVV